MRRASLSTIERTRRSVQMRGRALMTSGSNARSTRFNAEMASPMTIERRPGVRSNVSSIMLRAVARSDISETLGEISEFMGRFPAMMDIAASRRLGSRAAGTA